MRGVVHVVRGGGEGGERWKGIDIGYAGLVTTGGHCVTQNTLRTVIKVD